MAKVIKKGMQDGKKTHSAGVFCRSHILLSSYLYKNKISLRSYSLVDVCYNPTISISFLVLSQTLSCFRLMRIKTGNIQ